MRALLDKRLVFVTGKGGVGKSTVAAALGILAARAGRRTILVEVAHQERVAHAFEHDDSDFSEVEIAPGLFTISISPRRALEEYLQIQVRVKALADLLSGSRMFQYFAAATPGMSELLTMGKIWELAQPERRASDASPYDLVIVDAPATGHGVAVMRAPKTFSDIARVGPVAQQGRVIHEFVANRKRTGVLAVCAPEEMPVNETFTLRDELRRQMGLELGAVVLNGMYPDRFADTERATLQAALAGPAADSPVARAALRAALSEDARATAQREQCERLEAGVGLEPVELPFLFEPEIGRDEFERLSEVLEKAP